MRARRLTPRRLVGDALVAFSGTCKRAMGRESRTSCKEREVSERGPEEREPGEEIRACPVCGASTTAADRFCAQCGALLPANQDLPETDNPAPRPPAAPALAAPPRESAPWIFGARPAAVIGGGLLLALLAVALLFIGQLDDTGTIVMLSICVAPLALLTIVIGIARGVGRKTGDGGRR
jgi:hypothetical protein